MAELNLTTPESTPVLPRQVGSRSPPPKTPKAKSSPSPMKLSTRAKSGLLAPVNESPEDEGYSNEGEDSSERSVRKKGGVRSRKESKVEARKRDEAEKRMEEELLEELKTPKTPPRSPSRPTSRPVSRASSKTELRSKASSPRKKGEEDGADEAKEQLSEEEDDEHDRDVKKDDAGYHTGSESGAEEPPREIPIALESEAPRTARKKMPLEEPNHPLESEAHHTDGDHAGGPSVLHPNEAMILKTLLQHEEPTQPGASSTLEAVKIDGASIDVGEESDSMGKKPARNNNIAADLPSVMEVAGVQVPRLAQHEVDPNVVAAIRAHRYNKRHEPRLDDYREERCPFLRFEAANSIYLTRSFFAIVFRLTTLFVVSLAVGMTMLCISFGLYTDMPMSLLATGIIFPSSFGVQFNVNRRERVLLDIASLKASATGLFMLSREWPPVKEYQRYSLKMSLLLKQLLRRISRYMAHHENRDAHVEQIYHDFDEISHLLEEIRLSDEWVKSVISRGYQYVRYMINDFERLRVLADFRTPSTFRGFFWAFLLAFPVLFGPYFAKLAHDYGFWAGIYTSVVSSFMLVVLSGVMNDMEDPFTGDGVDDLNTEMIRESVYLMFPRKRRRQLEPRKSKNSKAVSAASGVAGSSEVLRKNKEKSGGLPGSKGFGGRIFGRREVSESAQGIHASKSINFQSPRDTEDPAYDRDDEESSSMRPDKGRHSKRVPDYFVSPRRPNPGV